MNTNILLVSEDTIKSNSLINNNVDGEYIQSAVLDAQLIGLQPTIGTMLYDKLCEMVDDGSILEPKNAKYKEILDGYVQPYLIQKTLADIQVGLWTKFRNAGMTQSNDDKSSQISIKDLQYIIQTYESKAAFYANRLQERLNVLNLKEWRNHRDCSDMKPTNSLSKFGITLGGIAFHNYK